jgi:hypothetical protein
LPEITQNPELPRIRLLLAAIEYRLPSAETLLQLLPLTGVDLYVQWFSTAGLFYEAARGAGKRDTAHPTIGLMPFNLCVSYPGFSLGILLIFYWYCFRIFPDPWAGFQPGAAQQYKCEVVPGAAQVWGTKCTAVR